MESMATENNLTHRSKSGSNSNRRNAYSLDEASLRKKISPTIRRATGPVIRMADLFSGCGGLTLGVLQACAARGRPLRITLALDQNAEALAVYRDNFSEISDSIELAPIESILDSSRLDKALLSSEKRKLSRLSGCDLIVAGPPCQGHSNLNNSSRRSDPRNELYMAPVRAALAIRPKVLVVENVPAVSHSLECVTQLSISVLRRAGYCVQEATLELSEYGIPQKRKRHIILATLKNFDLDQALRYLKVTNEPRLIDYIDDLQDSAGSSEIPINRTTTLSTANKERIDYLFNHDEFNLPDRLRPPCHRDKAHSYVSMYGRMHADKPAQTITSGFGSMGQGRFVHPTRRRMITAHEAARIQGFPDYFSFKQAKGVTSLREMIGNAAPPILTSLIVGLLIDMKLL